jgi:hypothetical protein
MAFRRGAARESNEMGFSFAIEPMGFVVPWVAMVQCGVQSLRDVPLAYPPHRWKAHL